MKDYRSIINYILEGSIEPLLICNETEVLGMNTRFLKLLDLANPILNLDLLKQHFQCKDNSKFSVDNLQFIKLKNRLVKIAIKKWNLIDMQVYSIGIENNYEHLKINSVEPALTPSVKDEEQLIHAKIIRELSLIFETMPCMIVYSDASGRQIIVNRLYKDYLKLVENEDLKPCVHPEESEQYFKNWKTSLEQGIKFHFLVRLRPDPLKIKGNEECYRWHIINAIPIKFDSNGGITRWITTITDIHDMKEVEAEKQKLISSEKLAIEESKMKSEFLAVMSHELRTPLFGVIGSASLLLESELKDEQKDNMENIYRSAQLLLAVIQDILEFTRIESGKLEIRPREFYISNMLKDVEQMMKVQAKQKNLDFIVEYDDFPYLLLGDNCRLQQIIINLTSNAIKFTYYGYVKISFTYKELNDEEVEIKITVADTGIGISSKSIKKLFNPWSQLEDMKTRKMEGSGLGLFICKSLVTLMNGDINISSELRKGTQIWINLKLPYKKQCSTICELSKNFNSTCLSPNVEIVKEPNAVKNFKFLVAEDNIINQNMLKAFIKKIGNTETDIFNDGKEALAQYLLKEKGHYDVIILDQLMPVMNGDVVCKTIKEIDKDQKIILSSANVFDKDESKKIGYDDYIAKPFTMLQFVNLIKKWLPDI